jgi:hypothetical protein
VGNSLYLYSYLSLPVLCLFDSLVDILHQPEVGSLGVNLVHAPGAQLVHQPVINIQQNSSWNIYLQLTEYQLFLEPLSAGSSTNSQQNGAGSSTYDQQNQLVQQTIPTGSACYSQNKDSTEPASSSTYGQQNTVSAVHRRKYTTAKETSALLHHATANMYNIRLFINP